MGYIYQLEHLCVTLVKYAHNFDRYWKLTSRGTIKAFWNIGNYFQFQKIRLAKLRFIGGNTDISYNYYKYI